MRDLKNSQEIPVEENVAPASGDDLLRRLEAERWIEYRRFYIWLGCVCAVPVVLTAALQIAAWLQ